MCAPSRCRTPWSSPCAAPRRAAPPRGCTASAAPRVGGRARPARARASRRRRPSVAAARRHSAPPREGPERGQDGRRTSTRRRPRRRAAPRRPPRRRPRRPVHERVAGQRRRPSRGRAGRRGTRPARRARARGGRAGAGRGPAAPVAAGGTAAGRAPWRSCGQGASAPPAFDAAGAAPAWVQAGVTAARRRRSPTATAARTTTSAARPDDPSPPPAGGLVAEAHRVAPGGHRHAADEVVHAMDRRVLAVHGRLPAGEEAVGEHEQRGVAGARPHLDALVLVAGDARGAGGTGRRAATAPRQARDRLLRHRLGARPEARGDDRLARGVPAADDALTVDHEGARERLRVGVDACVATLVDHPEPAQRPVARLLQEVVHTEQGERPQSPPRGARRLRAEGVVAGRGRRDRALPQVGVAHLDGIVVAPRVVDPVAHRHAGRHRDRERDGSGRLQAGEACRALLLEIPDRGRDRLHRVALLDRRVVAHPCLEQVERDEGQHEGGERRRAEPSAQPQHEQRHRHRGEPTHSRTDASRTTSARRPAGASGGRRGEAPGDPQRVAERPGVHPARGQDVQHRQRASPSAGRARPPGGATPLTSRGQVVEPPAGQERDGQHHEHREAAVAHGLEAGQRLDEVVGGGSPVAAAIAATPSTATTTLAGRGRSASAATASISGRAAT